MSSCQTEADDTARYARTKNKTAVIRIVLNRVKSGTLLTSAASAALKGTSASILPASLSERQSFQHAATRGWHALDAKAESEALQFTVAVTSIRVTQ